MDPAALQHLAPATSDNATVVLWVVGSLVIITGYLFRMVVVRQNESEARCRAESEIARKQIADAHQKLEDMARSVLTEQAQSQAQTLIVLQSVAAAFEKNTRVIDRFHTESGHHRTVNPPR